MEKISRVETFPNLVASKEPATVYDVACKSIPELVYLIMQRLNETIEHMNKNDATLQQQLDYVLAQLEEFYLKFDENLRQEIQIVLQAWIEDGTLEQVISQLVENRAVYPSVAALQQAPNIFQLGAIVELQGYHYAGDGAGHKRIIADSNDGGGILLYDKWANLIEDVVNVKHVGLINGNELNTNLLNNINREELVLYFPKGTYKILHPLFLKNKKIKIFGNSAIIEQYNLSGPALRISDASLKNTTHVEICGIDLINKAPKKSSSGLGSSGIRVEHCDYLTIRDVNVVKSEQYGLQLRHTNGTIKYAVLDNVKVLDNAGNLSTTTSIALETPAESTTGKIENLVISNCYFECTKSFVDEFGNIITDFKSNACKIQGTTNTTISNTTFFGGQKENGALSFIYDCENAHLTNVRLISDHIISKGLTIAKCPDLKIYIDNCDLGVENVIQSLGIVEPPSKIYINNSRLNRITLLNGTDSVQNIHISNSEFVMNSNALGFSFANSNISNCRISEDSTYKTLVVLGSNNKISGLSGITTIEVSGSSNTLNNINCESIRPSGTSSNNIFTNSTAVSSDRAIRTLASTVSDWTFNNCTFIRTVGGGTSHMAHLQGSNMILANCAFKQIDKTNTISFPLYVSNATYGKALEFGNTFDVNKTQSLNIRVENSTNFTQFEKGQTRLDVSGPQIWDGASWVSI